MITKEKDIEILTQLYNGHHLNEDEIIRANKLLYLLNLELKDRIERG